MTLLMLLAAMISILACLAAVRAHRRAQSLQRDIERLFDVAPPALLLDLRGRCIRANELATRRLRQPAAEIAGLGVAEVLGFVADKPALESLRLAIAEHRAWRPEASAADADPLARAKLEPQQAGCVLWLSPAPQADQPGEDAVAHALAQERRRVDAAASQLRHDLVQPLAAIHNYAEIIRQTSEPPTRDHATQIAAIVARLVLRLREHH